MEYSMLDELTEYVRKAKPPFKAINCRFGNSVPDAFESIIKSYVKDVRLAYENTDQIDSFNVVFTSDERVYLEILSNDKHSRVIIIDNNSHYDYLPPAKIKKEKDFIKDIEYKDNMYMQRVISGLSHEFKVRFLKNDQEAISIESMLKELTTNIINYIEFCIKERQKNIPDVFYSEPETSISTNRSRYKTNITESQPERVNEEIEFAERERILDNYNSEIEFNAKSTNSNSIYRVKVYNPIPKVYKLVLEPIEGTKYTKVVHINKDKLYLGEAMEIAVNALQLSRSETSEEKSITRHAHTTIDEYRKLLEYIAAGNDKGLNYDKKRAIEEAEKSSKTI